ncbi:hypothetical protein C8Q79DRAFT_967237 [Trametes meyenii]|nr:hypothetical protein C8Q79DRAFT_967237 [Trametes meyenii]
MSTSSQRLGGGYVRRIDIGVSGIPQGQNTSPRMHTRQARSRSRMRHKRPIRGGYDKQLVALLVVLTLAGLTCISTAYYLIAAVLGRPLTVDPRDSLAAAHTTTDSQFKYIRSERFIAYLPHSGFHNQRIALENALILATVLNRTLLLPPVRLGEPLSYLPFDQLYNASASAAKAGLGYCRDLRSFTSGSLPEECASYFRYTYMPWGRLVDISDIHSDQRLLEGWNFTDAWLVDVLGISSSNIHYLKDSTRTDYMFQDSSLDSPARKFLKSVSMDELAQRPERLIQLGTLFGSSRLYLRSSTNREIRRRVRERMTFTSPYLVDAAEGIRTTLGGSYLGAHLRIGDGIFEWNAPENVRIVWWKLLRDVMGFSDEGILSIERKRFPNDPASAPAPPTLQHDLPAARTPHPPLPPFPHDASPSPEFPCRAPLHTSPALLPLNAPLYVATDAHSPASNPLLKRFTHTFPCAFFLTDFPGHTEPLRALKSPEDGVPLARFLMPFLDAMVAGQAWQVVGTEQSTFSTFVGDVLWRRYHGFEIVQRG